MQRRSWVVLGKDAGCNGNLPYDSGNSNQHLVTTSRGRIGREVVGMFKWEGTWVNL